MKPCLYILMLATALTIPALSQETAPDAQNSSPPSTTPAEKQNHAATATKDNSAISGDQVTKPAGSKGTTLIGCLGGPNAEGKYFLTSMQHRTGVQVLGPDDLKKDSGSKVKLTGSWGSNPQEPASVKTKEARRFQVTAVEVVAQHCTAPSEKTPVSNEKQQRQEQEKQQNASPGAQSPK